MKAPTLQPIGSVAVGALAYRQAGATCVVVVAKAAFRMVAEKPMTVLPPERIVRADVHVGGVATNSVRAGSDLAPRRPRCDAILLGHAELGDAEGGVVRFAIIRDQTLLLDKSIHIVVEPASGTKRVPLVYERAYGGPDFPDNPAGTGRVPGSPEPALIDPADPRAAVGFGVIASAWPARARLIQGATRAAIQAYQATTPARGELPVLDVPQVLDWRFFQSAPEDQQTPYLRGDEWVAIDGAVPGSPHLRSRLPFVRAEARIQKPGGQPFPLAIDGLVVDADRCLCSLTFRGIVPFAANEWATAGDATIAVGVAVDGEPIPWPVPRGGMTGTVVMGDVEPERSTPKSQRHDMTRVDGTSGGGAAPAPASVLPFRQGVSSLATRAASGPQSGRGSADELGGTIAGIEPPRAPALPFGPSSEAAAAANRRAEVERRLAARTALDGEDLADLDLTGLDFSGASCVGATFDRAKLARCPLVGAKLDRASFGLADLEGAKLDDASCDLTRFSGASIKDASFDGARLDRADFGGAKGEGASFRRARGPGARFIGASLPRASFDGFEGDRAIWNRAALADATFVGARSLRASFLGAACDGARFDGATLHEARFDGASLRDASLVDADLRGGSIEGANATNAALAGATLTELAGWQATGLAE